tara:strand:- start:227 stop:712 length:486 start_codon:yes stop_codon:yes gene_type:complete
MLIRAVLLFFLFCSVTSQNALADPVIGDQVLPPASFTHVQDLDMLRKLGLDGISGGAWCYDNDANAILITAPARERAVCELNLQYELEKQKVKYDFEIDKLNIRIEALKKQHAEIDDIKNKEIEQLTEAALKRPNDYSAWWAAGGFATGVALTILTFLAVR